MVAGELFKEENVQPTAQEKFDLLPLFWQGMSEGERKVVMTVMETNHFNYTANTLQQLHVECSIEYAKMNDLRVCVSVAREHPESLAFQAASVRDKTQEDVSNDNQVVADVRASIAKLDDGLDLYQLKPKDSIGNLKLSGLDLFDHMVKYRNRMAVTKTQDGKVVHVKPADGLNVEISYDALACIQPTESDLRMGAVIKDSIGVKAKRKCAKRKLTNLGTIVGHSGVVNSEENMKKMKDGLMLAVAISEINSMEDANKEEKKKEILSKFNEKAPAAVTKLECNTRNIGSLTVADI